MPQMAPMNWFLLFMFFIFMLYIIMNFMFFNFKKNLKIKINNKNLMKNYNKFI